MAYSLAPGTDIVAGVLPISIDKISKLTGGRLAQMTWWFFKSSPTALSIYNCAWAKLASFCKSM